MTDSGHDCSLKEFVLLLSHVLLCAQGRASEHSLVLPSNLPPVLPAPVLIQEPSKRRAVELLCRAPSGYVGILFKLYRERDLVKTTEFGQDTQEARFSVVRERGARWKPYCCLYQNSDGVYSAFSPYLEPRASTVTAMNTTTAVQPPTKGHTDWPMIMGSISAVVLVMVVLTALGFTVRWKVKALAAERQKREEARFWHNFHAMDHVVDLTLRRVSVGSQEWDPVKDEKGSRTMRKHSSSSSDPRFYTFGNSLLR